MSTYEKSMDVLTSSGVRHLLKSPEHYRTWVESPDKETEAPRFGRALHCAVLQPEKFLNTYAFADFGDQRKKKNKAYKANFLAENKGKEILGLDDYNQINAMRRKLMAHPNASRLLCVPGVCETSVYCEIDGIKHRATPDKWIASANLLIDLKTTDSASKRRFTYSVQEYDYAVQAAFYSDVMCAVGHEVKTFLFLAIEKEPPFGIALYQLSNERLERAREDIRQAREILRVCLETNEWGGYPKDVQVIE